MATTLAEIRAKLQASEGRGGNKQSGGDNAIYPHWNIAEGSTTRVRFLPDGNTKNSFFWAERAMIRLSFAGVKGQADSKPVVVKYHVWKCTAKHVQSWLRYVLGLKILA